MIGPCFMDFLLGLTVGASAVLAWLATYHYDDRNP